MIFAPEESVIRFDELPVWRGDEEFEAVIVAELQPWIDLALNRGPIKLKEEPGINEEYRTIDRDFVECRIARHFVLDHQRGEVFPRTNAAEFVMGLRRRVMSEIPAANIKKLLGTAQ